MCNGTSDATSADRTANDVALDNAKRTIEGLKITGPVVLHCKDGLIRKTEVTSVTTTDSLLSDG